jgi:hypothetical protein
MNFFDLATLPNSAEGGYGTKEGEGRVSFPIFVLRNENIRQSFHIEGGIGYTTNIKRHVEFFIYLYDIRHHSTLCNFRVADV